MVLDGPLRSNGAVAIPEESIIGEEFYDPKNLSAGEQKARETPVEMYDSENEVPEEFLVNDPKSTPRRNWGDNDASGAMNFPVIDLSPLTTVGPDMKPVDPQGAKGVIQELGEACEKWGFFQVVNHGIPEPLLNHVMEVANGFFHLPVEEKQEYAVKPGEREGYGRLDFNLGGVVTGTRFWSDVMCHNIRPKQNFKEHQMPRNPEAYSSVIQEYIEGLDKVYDVIWPALSIHAGLAPETLRQKQGVKGEEILVLRLNSYPKCLEPEKVLGLGAHKDFGSLTVLLQDEVGGLQVQKRDSADNMWYDVKPERGALLINVANQVEILTNGKYHSVLHRAMVNRNSQRLSIVAFATPGPEVVIAPIPELLERTKELPRYKSLVFGDYARNFTIDVKAGIPPHARYEINRD